MLVINNETCQLHVCTAQPGLQCKASTAMLNMQSHMLSGDASIMQRFGRQSKKFLCGCKLEGWPVLRECDHSLLRAYLKNTLTICLSQWVCVGISLPRPDAFEANTT